MIFALSASTIYCTAASVEPSTSSTQTVGGAAGAADSCASFGSKKQQFRQVQFDLALRRFEHDPLGRQFDQRADDARLLDLLGLEDRRAGG